MPCYTADYGAVMEKLEGYVERIVYRNSENGYTVLELSYKEKDVTGEMTCVGSFPVISEGEYISVEGEFTDHTVYGRQLKVTGFTSAVPKSGESMLKYLGSGAIKGIGKALAERIVRRFGDATFDIIENEPERLAEVKGISENKARDIYEQFNEKREAREIMMYLSGFGIGTNLAVKIYKQYGKRTRSVLEENPYRLAEDISGVGFKTADEIARLTGCDLNSDFRGRAALIFMMNTGCSSGHTYLPDEVLLRHTLELTGGPVENLERLIDELAIQRKLIVRIVDGERRVYLSSFYYTELAVARMLNDLNLTEDINESLAGRRIADVQQALGINLDPLQEDALMQALCRSLLIITGGPGTGKTTILKAIIKMFKEEGLSILLAAPTGRAAKRMSEATGEEARTIHRMLEFAPNGDMDDNESASFGFQKNDSDPLDADVIIIDEASMIDIHLMHALLKAVTVGTRIIFTGDARQLPSVGPGNVLGDMVDSGVIPAVRLNKIFRQDESSDIVLNAHKINEGIHPTFDNKSDFFLMRRDQNSLVLDTVRGLFSANGPKSFPNYVKADPFDIQVLTPMRKGELGVENLNRQLQMFLNPPSRNKAEKQMGDRVFRVGDKVMQIKNDYQLEWKRFNQYNIAYESGLGIFNGDMGRITDINGFNDSLTVLFDEERVVEYEFSQLDELEHAYAVTVHKSQGSEYPAVIIPLLAGPPQLMTRNLIYTAVTRASRCVVVVGSENTLLNMIDNDTENKRFTGLREALVDIAEM